MKRFVLLPLIFLSTLIHATEENIPAYIAKGSKHPTADGVSVPFIQDGKVKLQVIPMDEPFLTGPLLAPSAYTIPYAHINLEPYVFVNNNIGYYNNHWHIQKFSAPQDNINFQYLVQCGLSSFMDFSFIPQIFYNYTSRKKSVRYGDFTALVGFQLYRSRFDSWWPSFKFEIGETFPTGRYDGLDELNLGTDIGGGGAYGTLFKLVATELWYFGGHHFLSLRMSNGILVFSDVRVRGLNAYGGDSTTNGTVKPGLAFNSVTGAEFTLTKHWALAIDMDFTWTAPTKFSGSTLAFVGRSETSYLLSFAPAIEYNFNANVGLIGGVWFSAIGDNSLDFMNGIFALNWYFP